MNKVILIVMAVVLLTNVAYAGRVYIEDDYGVVVPVDTKRGDIKTITQGDGRSTRIYDHGGSTDIVHPDGTTTHIFDGNYVK